MLLVFTPSLHDMSCLEQKHLFDEADVGLADHDLLVPYLFADQSDSSAAALRERFSIRMDAFTAVLIGKDGGEKERFLKPVHPKTLFSIIDQMPMRRREVEGRSQ